MAQKKRRSHKKHSQRKNDYSRRSIYDLLRDFVSVDYFETDRRSRESLSREPSDRVGRWKSRKRYLGYTYINSNDARRGSVLKRSALLIDKNEEIKHQEKLRIERICRERKDRRENLFRTKKAGKGKKIRKMKIYTEDSKIKCK